MTPAEYLQSLSPVPLMISWHHNASSYLSFRKERKQFYLRLHQLFAEAPPVVLDALARYLFKNDKSAKPILRKAVHFYFSENPLPSTSLNPIGSAYDLRPIYEQIKAQFFTPEYNAAIGWSDRIGRGRFRHITFGTYDRRRSQIRINPLLDQVEVPLYFLSFIVYHEMLHAVCEPTIDARGYTRCHTREFRRLEKLFPQYKEAKEWEKNSLSFFKRKSHGRS